MKIDHPFITFAIVAILAAVYFAAAKLGLSLAFVNASATAVWAPTGIALAALLLLGNRALPGILLGALLANATITGLTLTTIGIAIGNTLEAIVGAWLVNRFANGRHAFEHFQNVFKFTVLAAFISTTVSATIGVTSLILGRFADLADAQAIWITWWLGDAVGALLVTPVLVLWVARPRFYRHLKRMAEAALLLSLTILLGVAIFDGWVLVGTNNNEPLEYLIIPVLVWCAFRFGQLESATLILVFAGIAIWGTLHSWGPFVAVSPSMSLVLLQLFMVVIAVSTISLAAEVANRKQIEFALQTARDALQQRVDEQAVSLSGAEENLRLYADIIRHIPLGVAVLHLEKPDDLKTLKIVAINPNASLITGIKPEEYVGKYLIDVRPQTFETDSPKMYAEVIKTGKQRDFGEVPNTDPQVPSEWFAAKLFPLPGNRVAITLEDVSARKRTEEALRKQRELYDSLIQAQSDLGEGVALTEGTRMIYANQALAQMYGYTVEELLAMPSTLDLVAPEERDRLRERFRQRVAGEGMPEAVEAVAIHKDGHRINIEYAVKVIRDGDKVQLFSIIRDVTERKKAEEARRLSEELFSKAFHASPMGVVISSVDDGRIIEVNPAFEKIYGYSREEVIGRTSTELGIVDPKDRARGIEKFKREGYLRDFESTVRTKSGATRTVLSTTEFITFDGKQHLLGLTQDITEQKKGNDALRASEERFRLLIEGVKDYAIFTLDPNGNVLSWNPGAERIYGYGTDEILGKNISQFYTPEDQARGMLKYELDATAEQDSYEVEAWRMRKNGSLFWANILTNPLRDQQGKLKAFVRLTRDITERKKAEEKFRGVLESAPDAMIIVNREGKIQIINSQAEKMFGYRREELLGKPIETLIPARFREQHQIHRTNYALGPQAREMGTGLELYGLHRNKYEFPIDVSLSPLETDEGTLFTAAVRDITRRKRQEKELQESEEKLRLVVEGVTDYAIYLLDADGAVVSWNEGAERMFGYTEEEIAGQSSARFYTPEDQARDRPRRGLDAALKEGRFESDGWRIRKDGARFLAHTITTALRDEKGNLRGYAKISQDITERRRAEELLQKSETSLTEAQRVARVGSWEWDIATNTVSWSDQLFQLYGLPPQSIPLRYESFLERVHPDDRPRVDKAVKRAFQDHAPFDYEERVIWQDGSVHWLQGHGRVVLNEQGQPIKMYGTCQDIDERKRFEGDLHASREGLRTLSSRLVESQENERRRLARELHDEFGQLLTGLKMQLEAAAHSSDEPVRKNLQEAQAQVVELIAQTRAMSLELRPSMLDDLGLMPALLTHIDRFSAQTQVKVNFKQSGLEDKRFSPKVETAAYRIVQEALTNVARYAKVKQASVLLLANNGTLDLRVEDKGAGFHPDSAIAAAASSGLVGMSERVLALGGQFSIESKPGNGTCVIAKIPLAPR